MNPRKYLFLVDQPLQANMAAQIAKQILKNRFDSDLNLAFTDYYTFFLRKEFLDGFTAAWNGKIYTQKDLYLKWQHSNFENEVDIDYLSYWEKVYCKNRSLDQLLRTNQDIFGHERNFYQKQVSESWKLKILYDTILWSNSLLDATRPDVIISIRRGTLATNLIFEIAQESKVQFLTIIPSRLDKRWIVVDDFGYGKNKSNLNFIISNYSGEISKVRAEEEIHRLFQNKKAAYTSISSRISEQFNQKKIQAIKFFIKDLRLFAGRVYGRIFIQRKERITKSKRLTENFFKLSCHEFKFSVINFLRMSGIKIWGATKPPEIKYFFWALHNRPESSSAVLGDGKDEVEELLKVALEVPSGYTLAVKEHPIMFGTRKFGFYHALKKHKNVILIDPFCSTMELISRSTGVIGISGTVLLEAAMMDKPSYAIGNPEFLDFLVGSSRTGLAKFFDVAIGKIAPTPKEKILPYIAYVLDKGIENDSEVFAASDYPSSVKFSEKIANIVIKFSGN